MTFRITERIRTSFLDSRGVAVDGYRVFFQMEDGTVDKVEIKKSQYTPKHVKSEIENTIALHQAILDM